MNSFVITCTIKASDSRTSFSLTLPFPYITCSGVSTDIQQTIAHLSEYYQSLQQETDTDREDHIIEDDDVKASQCEDSDL